MLVDTLVHFVQEMKFPSGKELCESFHFSPLLFFCYCDLWFVAAAIFLCVTAATVGCFPEIVFHYFFDMTVIVVNDAAEFGVGESAVNAECL